LPNATEDSETLAGLAENAEKIPNFCEIENHFPELQFVYKLPYPLDQNYVDKISPGVIILNDRLYLLDYTK